MARRAASICIQGHFVKKFLRDRQPLDAEGFQVDSAMCDTIAQFVSAPTLKVVHDDRREANDAKENGEDNQ